MENYQMGRSCGRPYRTTCGMNRMPASGKMPACDNKPMPRQMSEKTASPCPCEEKAGCNCRMPGMASREAQMYAPLDQLPPTMAYVPCQKFTKTFELGYALSVGTVFPELCRPFCGKRGGCK